MDAIRSVKDAKAAFPALKWRDEDTKGVGEVAFAICGGDRETGDIIIFLAMGDGARAPLHVHNPCEGWPFRESITCFVGEVYGVDPDRPAFVLLPGMSIDIKDGQAHRPCVPKGKFALMFYRQPAVVASQRVGPDNLHTVARRREFYDHIRRRR